MLIALDIGNSNIKIGLWDENKWLLHHRFPTHPVHEAVFYRSLIEQIIYNAGEQREAVDRAVIGSVVPAATPPLTEALRVLFATDPLQVDGTLSTGIQLRAPTSTQIGADLIAGAVATHHLTKGAAIYIDCGTATTVMAIDESAVLRGGAICAGLKASMKALVKDTAQLPDIPLQIPDSPLGQNTVHCMQSGIVLGHLCMIEGLITRMKDDIGPAKVVGTGGLISVLAPHAACFQYVEPMLVLNGLRLICERQNN